MASSRYNPSRAKIHRSYTVVEVCELYGLHPNTVYGWVKRGLPVFSSKKPFLIQGEKLRIFLKGQRGQRRLSLRPGEIYCLPCRDKKLPADGMAEFVLLGNGTGLLRGICPSCDRLIQRFASVPQLDDIIGNLDVSRTGL